MIKLSDVKFDCRFFRGHMPCTPNKMYGVMCDDCEYYDKTVEKILIIKLGAAGDVVRTTPILFPIKKEFPNAKIYWLTYFPQLVPAHTDPKVDIVLEYSVQNVIFLQSIKFDKIINLDKDNEAISLTERIQTKNKTGYIIKDGTCYPANKDADHKFLTGIFDNVSMVNTKNYMQEIFEICGYEFNQEKYLIDIVTGYDKNWAIDTSKKVIGLNTGCGERWTSRLWKDEYWIELIRKLQTAGFEVILLGGPSENLKNNLLNEATGAKYFGVHDIRTFINLVNKCELIITQVTMTMHLALALEKKLVLMNNIFNPSEFYLYGNGEIVQPRKKCICYFQSKCINKEYQCMDHMMPDDIFEACMVV